MYWYPATPFEKAGAGEDREMNGLMCRINKIYKYLVEIFPKVLTESKAII
jgi:hypothetical protein